MNRSFKSSCITASLLFLLFTFNQPCFTQGTTGQSSEENIGFTFGFGAKVGPEGERQFVPITRDTVMKSGDSLKMVVQLDRPCYVYLIYQSSTNEVEMLFPYDLKQFTKDYIVDKNYYIPKGQAWSWLDENAGKETFYLLATTNRLTDLEALLGQYASAKGAAQSDLSKKIVTEVRNLKKKYRTFATLAERPISIGGNVRGGVSREKGEPDVASIAVQISANNFYSKTFTIDHQK